MKKILLLVSITLLCLFVKAQFGTTAQWTWVKGDNNLNRFGVYGTIGVTASTNKPGGRMDGAMWTDPAGNFWMFGGNGYPAAGPSGFLSDLWKYNPATNLWTWVSGNSTVNQLGVYGTMGVAAAGNKPGARRFAGTWVDAAGNLWMFGGEGYDEVGGTTGYLNDVWKYDPVANLWTWINGDKLINQAGVYGTKGVTAPTNKPGGRHNTTIWKDASGTVWMFGGHKSDDNFLDRLSDLWKYDPVTNQWTWVSGDNVVDQSGVYGTKGVAAPGNKPGAREAVVSWVDAAGNFWLFGGEGRDEASTSLGYLDDLWKYDPVTNQWTWINGDKLKNQASVYGTLGVPTASNKPGGRYGAAVWVDEFGNVAILGGIGSGSTYLDDIWRYDPATNQWTWQKGDNTTNVNGVYGVQGSQGAANKPGSRRYAAYWTDVAGNFWLFGGDGYDASSGVNGRLNDLWKISDLVLPVKYESFTATKARDHVLLNWVTSQEFNSSRFEIEHSTDGIHYAVLGIQAAAGNTSQRTSYEYTHATPAQGANFYRLKQVDLDEKYEYSEVRKVVFEGNAGAALTVYGNPFQSQLSFSVGSLQNEQVVMRLTDISGKSVWTRTAPLQKGVNNFSVDGARFTAGVYVLSVYGGSGVKTVKVVKQ